MKKQLHLITVSLILLLFSCQNEYHNTPVTITQVDIIQLPWHDFVDNSSRPDLFIVITCGPTTLYDGEYSSPFESVTPDSLPLSITLPNIHRPNTRDGLEIQLWQKLPTSNNRVQSIYFPLSNYQQQSVGYDSQGDFKIQVSMIWE